MWNWLSWLWSGFWSIPFLCLFMTTSFLLGVPGVQVLVLTKSSPKKTTGELVKPQWCVWEAKATACVCLTKQRLCHCNNGWKNFGRLLWPWGLRDLCNIPNKQTFYIKCILRWTLKVHIIYFYSMRYNIYCVFKKRSMISLHWFVLILGTFID